MKKQISYNTQYLGDLEVQNQSPQNNSKKAANTAYVDEAVPEMIVGTHGATATPTWTGTSTRLSQLKTGTMIIFAMTSAGTSAGDTLNLTLKDGTTTGAKKILFKYGAQLKTEFPAYNKLLLVYNPASENNNGAWWVLNPYTNTTYTMNYTDLYLGTDKTIIAGSTGIVKQSLLMIEDSTGHWVSLNTTYSNAANKPYTTVGLRLGPGLAWSSTSGTSVAAGAKFIGNVFQNAYPVPDAYSFHSPTPMTVGEPIYVKGEVHSDGLFYLDSSWATQTVPTTENGKVYIFVGHLLSTSKFILATVNPAYCFYDGQFRLYEQAQRMRADAALREKTEIEFASACPNNKIMYDDYGNPSVMVYIPPFKLSDVIPGAADTQIGDFWIGKYQASLIGDVAVSLPNKDPKTNMTYAQAKAYCEGKGEGWHLMTREEWADIELWCLANNIYPKGNGQYGKSFGAVTPEGVPTSIDSDTNLTGRIATGTGPLSYSHNGEPSGIWDMSGNVREMLDGVRIFYGEVQILDGNTWKAINAADGTLITPAGDGSTTGSVKTDFYSSNMVYSTTITQRVASVTCWTKNITADSTIGTTAIALLQRLCLLPISSYMAQQQGLTVLWNNNSSNSINIDAGGRYSDDTIGISLNRVGIDSYDFIQQGGSTAPKTGFRIAYKQPTRGNVLPISGGDDDITQQNNQR